ncbi:MAG: glycogen/starch synthase, partial [Waddliaceae bacterium]
MSIKPLSPTLPQGAYTHRSKDEQVRRCPPLWKCNKRREAIEQRIERVQAAFQTVNEDLPSDQLKQCADSIKAVQLGTIQETILKVANVVSKIFCFIFHIKFHQIDALLRSNKDARRIYRDLTDILRPVSVGDLDFVAETVDSKYDKNLRLVLFSYKIKKVRDSLYHFEQQLSQEGATNAELFEAYNSLPPVLKRSLQEILRSHYQDIDSKVSIQKLIKSNPRVFLSLTKNNKNAIKQLVEYFDEAIAVHKGAVNRKAGVPSGCGKDSSVEVGGKDAQPDEQLISVHDFLRNLTPQNPSGEFSIYDISFDKVCRELKKEVSEEPITVTMVGVEFANLVKVGGLAEALEGLSQGMRALNPNNRVKLVFPLFSTLPEEVKQLIEKTPSVTYQSSKGESFSVTTVDFNGVECSFIEHPEFELEEEDPNIYGPDWETQATRFATFSELAADLIYRKKDTDIIHLHDWHVAGVALKLKREHKEEWKSGQIPPVVFTFH